MKSKKTEKIVADKVAEIIRLCKLVDMEFEPEAIHKFRVAVKSLRSFLALLATDECRPAIKLPKSFLRLYHITGTIRQAQLELAYLKKMNFTETGFSEVFKGKINEGKESWQKHYTEKTLRKLKARLEEHDYGKLSPQALDTFLSSSMRVLDPLKQNKALTDEQLHSARKKIKNVIHVAKIANKEWKKGNERVVQLPLDKLEKLASQLGGYNDDRILLEDLDTFMANSKHKVSAAMKILTKDEELKLVLNKKEIVVQATRIPGL